jgi:hypothetical protein
MSESHEQKKRRGLRRTGFTIEDFEAVNVGGSIFDGGRGAVFLFKQRPVAASLAGVFAQGAEEC